MHKIISILSIVIAVLFINTVHAQCVGGTAVAANPSICSGTGTTISVSVLTGTIQWEQSNNNSTWVAISGGSTATNTSAETTLNTPFSYTGSQQSFVVPLGVTAITAEGFGAAGGHGSSDFNGKGGLGGRLIANLSTTSGETLFINVGEKGHNTAVNPGTGQQADNLWIPSNALGGFNGGGNGFSGSGGGGGGTDIRQGGNALANRIFIVGSGGGGGTQRRGTEPGGNGGNGGGPSGANGISGSTSVFYGGVGGVGGGGGSSSGGGSSANSNGATNGSLGQGGTGATSSREGGGGGGGYYGGGGGSWLNDRAGGGGGGGSSYSSGSITTNTQGDASANGNGSLILTYTVPPTITSVYTTPNLSSTMYYRAVVTDGACVAYSTTATVVVNARPVPSFVSQPGATACANTDVSYATQSGQSNYVWTIPGVLNTDYAITSGGTSADNSIVLKWLTPGNRTATVNYTNTNNCAAMTPTSSLTTTVSATSIAGTISGAGAICTGTSKTLILSGHTGTVTKWQSSLTSDFSSGITDIANTTTSLTTPTLSTATYYRAVVTSGVCPSVNSNSAGVTVTPNNTATLSSAIGTTTQTLHITVALTAITYTTVGASGATFSGLPSGVSGSWSANMVTISGTPVVTGVFNYTVTLTGGCGTTTVSGSITVLDNPDLNSFSAQTKTFFDQSYTITAPVSSGSGAITYTSSNTAVATVSGNNVTIVGAGTTTITATQVGDDVYYGDSISALLTVNGVTVLTKNGDESESNLNYVNKNGALGTGTTVTKYGDVIPATSQ